MRRRACVLLWHQLIIEPLSWQLMLYLRPGRFQYLIEPLKGRQRVLLTTRVILPIFLYIWPLSFLIHTLIAYAYHEFYFPIAHFSTIYDFSLSVQSTIRGCLEGLLLGLFGGIFISCSFGVSAGIVASLIGGVMSDLQTTSLNQGSGLVWFFGLITGVSLGLAFGLPASSSRQTERGNVLNTLSGVSIGLFSGIVSGCIFGLAAGIVLGSQHLPVSGLYGTFAGALVGGLSVFFFFLLLKNLLRNRRMQTRALLQSGQAIGVVFGTLIGTPTGTGGFVIGKTGRVGQSIASNWSLGLWLVLITGGCFLVSYLVGYYRLPLYPFSAYSSWRAYRSARRHPKRVFQYLRRSALYWDERVFLTLPYLRHLLLDAALIDQERVRQVIEFIVAERPEQTAEVRDACIEITLRELEQRNNLRSISSFDRWFVTLFPQGIRLIDVHWNTPFEHFCHVSRVSHRYNGPLSWQARKQALIEVENSLRRIRAAIAFESVHFNHRLQGIVDRWLLIIEREQERYNEIPEEVGNLPNPYISGQAIQPDDPMFVGRRDLVQRLERALNREQYHPTFFLTGERRMGKSSTLNQLHSLLSSRYIPITLDLQFRGKLSSASAFLWSIADEIVAGLESKGITLRRLDFSLLTEAGKENEAAVYREFEPWLRELESILAKTNHVVLLAFDEFEKLEESAQADYLDLRLLLDWFRSTIQHSKCLVLLFSGVKQLGEMGPLWAGYFVNVETLRVSFLHFHEAYRLITQPVPQFPSEQIYSEGVVERIMEVTALHPFLTQALCSKLIDNLNAFKRDWAELYHIDAALEEMLDSWWSTYFQDLWERTDREQRLCLLALKAGKDQKCTIEYIEKSTLLMRNIVRSTLERLRQRDLIIHEDGSYRLASLIIERWVERNS